MGRERLLDHSIFMYGSNMSNSDLHNNYPEPNILVGGGNGKMKLGRPAYRCCRNARRSRIST